MFRRPARLLALVLSLVLAACSASDALRAARIAATGDAAAAGRMAAEKAARYAANPAALEADLKRFKKAVDALRNAAGKVWGKGETREPSPKEYVKYVSGYKSRALVDFDAGLVTVETVDAADPAASLRRAVASTVLTPLDPRAVDLYSDAPVPASGEPFLRGEVKDFEGRDIIGQDQADAFAARLVAETLRTRQADGRTVSFVAFPLVPDHLPVRAAKYRPLVEAAADRFGVSRSLVYAVMRTESSFNPYAVSSAGAFGLMQVVPSSAGAEVRGFLDGDQEPPTPAFLLDPANSITYGSAYLHLLDARHLARVADPTARQYCQIAAYNTGPGNVLRTFARDRDAAFSQVNGLRPDQVYGILAARLPYAETRRYLGKVTQAQKDFVVF
ncbi:MAG: murein transglycosylase domain-containing protein [Thermodesulfobacteriota bacterium]